MTRHYTRWTKELLEPFVKSSISYAECLKKMNLKPLGGNYRGLQRNIDKFELDTSHMLHQAHNSGKEIKKLGSLVKKGSIRKRLLKELGHKCQKCELTSWQGKAIPLELEHVDGDNRNNSRENLTLLCCNCHALTPTWRNRKR